MPRRRGWREAPGWRPTDRHDLFPEFDVDEQLVGEGGGGCFLKFRKVFANGGPRLIGNAQPVEVKGSRTKRIVRGCSATADGTLLAERSRILSGQVIQRRICIGAATFGRKICSHTGDP